MYYKSNVSAYLWCLPAILLFAITILYPTSLLIFYSFTSKTIGGTASYVALDNFKDLYNNTEFWSSIYRTGLFILLVVPLKVIASYILSFVIDTSDVKSYLFWITLLIPWLIPSSMATLLWLWLFYEPGGLLFNMLGSASIATPIGWLTNGKLAFAVIGLFSIWREAPFWGLVLASARKSVPIPQQEQISSVNSGILFQERHLYIPYLRSTLLIVTAFIVVWTFAEFETISILTGGGPSNATQTIIILAHEMGYSGGIDLGMASAVILMALPFLLIIVVPLLEVSAICSVINIS